MNIGIVVEGDLDAAVYPELIKKIRHDVDDIPYIVCGSVAKLRKKFVGWLKYFEWHAALPVDKVLVIVDSDCSDASAGESVLRQLFELSHFAPRFPVHFHATKCEIETWLLADERAISQVSQRRGKNRAVPAVTIPFESYKNAKELFQGVLSKAGLPAIRGICQEIAVAADIGLITARCPSFQKFAQKVLAC